MGILNDINDKQEVSLSFLKTQNLNHYVLGHKFTHHDEDGQLSVDYVGDELKEVFYSNLQASGCNYVGRIACKVSVLIREIENQNIAWIMHHDITHYRIVSKESFPVDTKIII